MSPRTIYLILCVALVAVGCGRVPQADRDAVLETVRRNVRLLQEKRIDEMMETIHSQSPAFAGTRKSVTELTKEFDLKCDLERLEVVGARRGDVRVRFEQITKRKKGGVAEPRTRLAGVHVLRQEGGVWKIFDTEVISAEVVDPLPEEGVTP